MMIRAPRHGVGSQSVKETVSSDEVLRVAEKTESCRKKRATKVQNI